VDLKVESFGTLPLSTPRNMSCRASPMGEKDPPASSVKKELPRLLYLFLNGLSFPLFFRERRVEASLVNGRIRISLFPPQGLSAFYVFRPFLSSWLAPAPPFGWPFFSPYLLTRTCFSSFTARRGTLETKISRFLGFCPPVFLF